jgi:hypothetical protein
LQSQFFHDVLSVDLVNHFAEYAKANDRLQKDIAKQDGQFRTLLAQIMNGLRLPVESQHLHHLAARALLAQCLGRGPAMVLSTTGTTYSYSWVIGGGVAGGGPPPPEALGAFQGVKRFKPSAGLKDQCHQLQAQAEALSARATQLATDARLRAELPTLPGTCAYVELE